MSATATAPARSLAADQCVVLNGLGWDAYVTINDAVREKPHVRMIHVDRRLTLLIPARPHWWYAERLADIARFLAAGGGIFWETAGSATFRRADLEVGVEGDRTFYLREHAEIMKGPRNIDLSCQPPPDVAIEVEVSHPADDALLAWGRIGVPEIWRFDAEHGTLEFCQRGPDGNYRPESRSTQLPPLSAEDVLAQLQFAEEMGSSHWYTQAGEWARGILAARPSEGG
jgi:Uma2 family endonuclease